MSAIVVHPATVVPAACIDLVLAVSGVLVLCYVVRSSLASLAESAEEESVFLGFISPVHFYAVLYCIFFVIIAFEMALLPSNWYNTNARPNCTVTWIISGIAFTGAKASQYAFFASRMYFVFKGTNLEVPQRQLKQIFAVIVLFAISFPSITAVGSFTPAANAVGAGQYQVCPPGDGGFGIFVTLTMGIYIVCDTYVMISVIYGFVWRLLEIPKPLLLDNESDVQSLKDVRDGAFTVLLLALTTFVLSYIFTLAQMSMATYTAVVGWVFPVVDLAVNLGVIVIGLLTNVHNGFWLIQNRHVLMILFALERQAGVKKELAMTADGDGLASHLDDLDGN